LHGNRLFEIFKNTAIKSKLIGKYMYDANNGLWCNTEDDFKDIVHKHLEIFTAMRWDDRKMKYVYTHTNNVSTMIPPAMERFWTLAKKGTLDCNNSIGFLLFNNGVLDCYNMKMLDFDPKYNFTKKINRDFFPENVDKSLVDELLDKLFTTAYTKGDNDVEKRDYFLEKNAIAICEGGSDKEMMTLLGDTNCGKGVFTSGLKYAFDEFVTSFNTSVLLQGSNANLEDASKWRFLIKCHDSRIMIGNEVPIESEETTNQYGKKTEKRQTFEY
jgi:hypothetical protein